MGNNPSRVAPAHSLHIFDNQTRARYKNQREANQLRLKLRAIRIKESDVLSRLAFEQQDAKMRLHELKYDKMQRQLYKSIDERRKKVNPSVFSVSHLDNQSPVETTTLLLHQLNESMIHEKTNTIANKQGSASKKTRPLSAFESFQLQYSSKIDVNRNPGEHTEKHLKIHARTLQRETEQMKKSIKTAVAKASRDSNIVARRDVHYH